MFCIGHCSGSSNDSFWTDLTIVLMKSESQIGVLRILSRNHQSQNHREIASQARGLRIVCLNELSKRIVGQRITHPPLETNRVSISKIPLLYTENLKHTGSFEQRELTLSDAPNRTIIAPSTQNLFFNCAPLFIFLQLDILSVESIQFESLFN